MRLKQAYNATDFKKIGNKLLSILSVRLKDKSGLGKPINWRGQNEMLNFFRHLFGIPIPPSKAKLMKYMYMPYVNDWWNK